MVPRQDFGGLNSAIPALIASAELASRNRNEKMDRLLRGITEGANLVDRGLTRRAEYQDRAAARAFEGEQRNLDRGIQTDQFMKDFGLRQELGRGNLDLGRADLQFKKDDSARDFGLREADLKFKQDTQALENHRAGQLLPHQIALLLSQVAQNEAQAGYYGAQAEHKIGLGPEATTVIESDVANKPWSQISSTDPQVNSTAKASKWQQLVNNSVANLSKEHVSLNDVGDVFDQYFSEDPRNIPQEYRPQYIAAQQYLQSLLERKTLEYKPITDPFESIFAKTPQDSPNPFVNLGIGVKNLFTAIPRTLTQNTLGLGAISPEEQQRLLNILQTRTLPEKIPVENTLAPRRFEFSPQ